MKEGALQQEIKKIVVTSSGKTKEETIGKIFQLFRKKVNSEISGIIIKLEPVEVYINKIEEEKKIEKFLELFMPREKIFYTIEVEIEYQVKYLTL